MPLFYGFLMTHILLYIRFDLCLECETKLGWSNFPNEGYVKKIKCGQHK